MCSAPAWIVLWATRMNEIANRGVRWVTRMTTLAVFAASACGEVAETTTDAPSSTGDAATGEFTLTIAKSGEGDGTISSVPSFECDSACRLTAPANTLVTLTATPGTESVLGRWSLLMGEWNVEECTTTPTCRIELDRHTTIDARFEKAPVSITVGAIGNGTGTIRSSPWGIDCGGDCTEEFPIGTSVVFSANPGTGSTFLGWMGGGCSGTDPCMLVVEETATIKAMFALNNTLVVSKLGDGMGTVTSPSGINCGAVCIETVVPNGMVMLTASPAAGSQFAGWGGACTGIGNGPTCMVTISAATSVSATFNAIRHPLTITKLGDGVGTVKSNPPGIACGSDCSESFLQGTTVELTAEPATGTVFSGWTGACTGTGPCSVLMTAASSVTATFALTQHDLTTTKTGNGSGVISGAGIFCGADCKHTHPYGTVVQLAATPDAGSTFGGWSGGGCSGTGMCTVTMTAATTVTASFTLTQHQLTVSRTGTGTGTVTSIPAGISCGTTCTKLYDWNTTVTLTAAPSATSAFMGWSGACGGAQLTCTVVMTLARSVTATFQPRGVLYTIGQSDDVLRRLDPVTLQYTDVGPLGVDFEYGDCAWSASNGTLYMVPAVAQHLYRVNTTTGAATLVGVHGIAQLRALAVYPPTGQLYAIGSGQQLYRIDPATAVATLVVTTGIVLDGLVWDSRRSRMVGLTANVGGGSFYVMNLSTGAAVNLGSAGSINNNGLAYDSVIDRHWAVDTSGKLLEFDPNAGMARTERGTNGGAQTCITFRP